MSGLPFPLSRLDLHAIAADIHKQPRHKSMVEILGIIVVADGVRKLAIDEVLCCLAVACFERMFAADCGRFLSFSDRTSR